MNKKSDIFDINNIHQPPFAISKSLSTDGYKFNCNVKITDTERLEMFSSDKYILYQDAYNIYGDLLEEYIAIYEKVIDYKTQCLCGSKEFFNQKFRVYFTYDTMQFRICKKCGTMKMLSGYYNDEECKYMDTVQYKENKGE